MPSRSGLPCPAVGVARQACIVSHPWLIPVDARARGGRVPGTDPAPARRGADAPLVVTPLGGTVGDITGRNKEATMTAPLQVIALSFSRDAGVEDRILAEVLTARPLTRPMRGLWPILSSRGPLWPSCSWSTTGPPRFLTQLPRLAAR